MRILKANGAWSLESPAPMLVTTDRRLIPLSFIALITLLVPSVSMVSPTVVVVIFDIVVDLLLYLS